MALSAVLCCAAASAAAQPGWTVTAASFESSMTATVAVSLDGLAAPDDADLLASFVGEEVRGVATLTRVGAQDLFFLLVYADGRGEEISFRYYDAAGDRICLIAGTVTFEPNAVEGSLTEPMRLAGSCASGTGRESEDGPGGFSLGAVFPNPTAGTFSLIVQARHAQATQLSLYDGTGRRIASRSEAFQAGPNRVDWSADSLVPGAYFLVSESGAGRHARSLMVSSR